MNILCVGKNYAKHAAELGDAAPERPIWFWKPAAAIIHDGDSVRIPSGIGAVHHEVEWAVRIGADGRPDAMTVAIDVTARDLQSAAKRAGHPWSQAKGYDSFLPLGPWVPFAPGPHRIRLSVEAKVRQDASTADMTWDLDDLLADAATWTTLAPGDVLLTGTPDGVGPLEPGQRVRAELVGHASLSVGVASRP